MPVLSSFLADPFARAVVLAAALPDAAQTQADKAASRQFSWYLGVLIILAVFAVLLLFVLFLRVARAYWLSHPRPRATKRPAQPQIDPWEESARRMPTPPPPPDARDDDSNPGGPDGGGWDGGSDGGGGRGGGGGGGWGHGGGGTEHEGPRSGTKSSGYVPRHPPRTPPLR